MSPALPADEKLKTNEHKDKKIEAKWTQQPTADDAATPKTPALKLQLRRLEEIPSSGIVRPRSQKSNDSKPSSSSSKKRLPPCRSKSMIVIPARSTSTPINESKAASSKSAARAGTPRPNVSQIKSPEKLQVTEKPASNSSANKYADIKAKVNTHREKPAPKPILKQASAQKVVENKKGADSNSLKLTWDDEKPAREKLKEKLSSKTPKLEAVLEVQPAQKTEEAAAPAEALEEIEEPAAPEPIPAEAVVDEHVQVPDFQEDAKYTPPVEVSAEEEAMPETTNVDATEEVNEMEGSTAPKVLLGVAAVGGLALVGFVAYSNWDKVVEKCAPLYKTVVDKLPFDF